ncbi:MAG: hypothetical protein J7M25_11115, partial [Deltaproteobacteria bacterium]|nr:hypothetical protein [Deltaproteobacteria bacterium]
MATKDWNRPLEFTKEEMAEMLSSGQNRTTRTTDATADTSSPFPVEATEPTELDRLVDAALNATAGSSSPSAAGEDTQVPWLPSTSLVTDSGNTVDIEASPSQPADETDSRPETKPEIEPVIEPQAVPISPGLEPGEIDVPLVTNPEIDLTKIPNPPDVSPSGPQEPPVAPG